MNYKEYEAFVNELADTGAKPKYEILRAVVGIYCEYQEWLKTVWSTPSEVDEASDVIFWMVRLNYLLDNQVDLFNGGAIDSSCSDTLNTLLDAAEKQSRHPSIRSFAKLEEDSRKLVLNLAKFNAAFVSSETLEDLIAYNYDKLTGRHKSTLNA